MLVYNSKACVLQSTLLVCIGRQLHRNLPWREQVSFIPSPQTVNPSLVISVGSQHNHSITSTRSTVILWTYWLFPMQQPSAAAVLTVHWNSTCVLECSGLLHHSEVYTTRVQRSEVYGAWTGFFISSSSEGSDALILLSHYPLHTHSPP
jgi:hypothetical protein